MPSKYGTTFGLNHEEENTGNEKKVLKFNIYYHSRFILFTKYGCTQHVVIVREVYYRDYIQRQQSDHFRQ